MSKSYKSARYHHTKTLHQGRNGHLFYAEYGTDSSCGILGQKEPNESFPLALSVKNGGEEQTTKQFGKAKTF